MIDKESLSSERLKNLTIDCRFCCGLCCVALYFAKSEGFPHDKPAGKPCTNLAEDFSCRIHSKLKTCKLKGCLSYECFGAGQIVTQGIFSGADWKSSKETADLMFKVFLIVYQLQQMKWYLAEASTLIPAEELRMDIEELILENEKMTGKGPKEIMRLNVEAYRIRVNQVLKKAGELVRLSYNCVPAKLSNVDCMGRNFKRADLSGQDYSMTLMIAANLEGCKLEGTNFLGADLRDTNIRNTDLSQSIFLTQGQLNAAKGNRSTKLPKTLVYPALWEK